VATLADLSDSLHVIFPVHPRTRQRLESLGPAFGPTPRLRLLEPLPYLEFLALQRRASLVITDSGGIQEETTFLGVPCLTVRENTERPITVTQGTNQLVGRNQQRLRTAAEETLRRGSPRAGQENLKRVPLWDGHAAERIAEIILRRPAG
jgi:UDP-N-acetylglucosamine 2-epimerase (non-hydrolysing)